MPLEPRLHLRMLMSGVVVNDQVQVILGDCFPINRFQKFDPLLMTMALLALRDERAVHHTQRREQRRCTMALVIVCHGPQSAREHGQTFLCSIEGLDLTFLIHAQNHRPLGRIEVEPDDIPHFGHKVGVSGELEGLLPVRLKSERLPYPMNGDVI